MTTKEELKTTIQDAGLTCTDWELKKDFFYKVNILSFETNGKKYQIKEKSNCYQLLLDAGENLHSLFFENVKYYPTIKFLHFYTNTEGRGLYLSLKKFSVG